MQIPSYNAFQWRELWEVIERRHGCVWRTRKTEWHVPSTWQPIDDFIAVSLSTNDTKKPEGTINPHPTFK